ncbi:hypothetical protein RhiirB3_503700 [Rhizophagus irregularis]|nr:hypothetical protein RhiirB3_503700 [Rhizophagus irregularis]
MPDEACPLVSLSSNLAVLETRSWLKSALWCLSQVVDLFYNFPFTWNDLKHMGLVAATGKTPSWFRIIISLSSLTSLLPKRMRLIDITPSLSTLVGKFVDTINTSSYIRLRNKYYWIAGIDSSNSLIFGRVFYTFDDDSGTRVVYFSHWILTMHNQMQITPCPGCSLSPLALKTVGGKLIHRSCLSVLPSYRCLQLFQMTVHVDISQQIINLKLSPFILCSYFRFLSGFSELYVPDRYIALAQLPLLHCDSSPAYYPILLRQTLYPNNAVTKTSVFTQFRLKLWFDELPIMYKLSQRFPGLYADNSLCPICGTFMKTLEYLFICSPSYLDVEDDNPVLLNHKDVTTDLIERFLVKLATKASSHVIFRGALFAALVLIINLYLLTPIISRIYLKLQHEIYHGLWRSRCKIKVTKDTAKGILPSTLRSYKGPSVQPFCFSAPPIALSQADEPLSPLQASEWSSLGIKWLHSSLTQRLSWFHHLLGFLKSRTVLIWNNILAGCKIG